MYVHRHYRNPSGCTWWEWITLCCYCCQSLAGLQCTGQVLKPIPTLTSNPWSTRTRCARNLSGDPHHCFQSKGFFPNELSVQQMIHFDQSVASDITEMAELSQQQKSHEERDTQSLLHAKLLVSKTNKLQTLANRSLFKTQTSSSKDLHLLNLCTSGQRSAQNDRVSPNCTPACTWLALAGRSSHQHRQATQAAS